MGAVLWSTMLHAVLCTTLPLQPLQTGLQAERKGILNIQEDCRACKTYNVTTNIPGTKDPLETYIAGTTLTANIASTVVPSVGCTYRQTSHTQRFGSLAYIS